MQYMWPINEKWAKLYLWVLQRVYFITMDVQKVIFLPRNGRERCLSSREEFWENSFILLFPIWQSVVTVQKLKKSGKSMKLLCVTGMKVFMEECTPSLGLRSDKSSAIVIVKKWMERRVSQNTTFWNLMVIEILLPLLLVWNYEIFRPCPLGC